MKYLLVLLMSTLILIINGTEVIRAQNHEDFYQQAVILKELGLFKGTNNGFELNRMSNRVEAGVIIVRLLGKEEEAIRSEFEHPFTDVPDWANAYIGYLYHNNLTQGIGNNLYGSNLTLTPNQFLTFCLRAIDYDDQKGDFVWTDAINKSLELHLINDSFSDYLKVIEGSEGLEGIYRDDIVAVIYNLLNQRYKNKDSALIDFLISEGITNLDTALNLGIYKQFIDYNFNGIVKSIDNVKKSVIYETINDVNYILMIPFGNNETPYIGSFVITDTNGQDYTCFLSKDLYYQSQKYIGLGIGDSVAIKGELAVNLGDQENGTRYIFLTE